MKLGLALLLVATPALADEATDTSIHESDRTSGGRAPTGSFTIGAGYQPDDGFIAHAEVAQDDLFRTGQRLALSADISAIRQRLQLEHAVPDLFGSGLNPSNPAPASSEPSDDPSLTPPPSLAVRRRSLRRAPGR